MAPPRSLRSEPEGKRGASFGLHKALDKAGAIVGPFVAFALLDHFGQSLGSFHTLFLIAVIPAFASVAVLLFFVPERKGAAPQRIPLREALRTLGPGFRHYLISAGLFSFAYFSYAFLMLAAANVHFESKHVALLYGLFNVSFTLLSVPIGKLGDTGAIYLPASLGAGLLWKLFSPQVTFGVAAGVALGALVYFLAFQPRASPETVK